jgi:hypothetical protein
VVDQTDPVRDLVRRAYGADDDLDVTAGLHDVTRRASVVELHPAGPQPPLGPHRRHRGGLAVVTTFAAALLVLFVGIAVAGRGLPDDGVGGRPSQSAVAGPEVLPTPCAGDWTMTLRDGEFSVTGTNPECPPLPRGRLLLMDAAKGNGLIQPGFATAWPLDPTSTATVTPPFRFMLGGWPGPAQGHSYTILYLPPDHPMPKPGDDVWAAYQYSYTVSNHRSP